MVLAWAAAGFSPGGRAPQISVSSPLRDRVEGPRTRCGIAWARRTCDYTLRLPVIYVVLVAAPQ